jgi:hypothetical protein
MVEAVKVKRLQWQPLFNASNTLTSRQRFHRGGLVVVVPGVVELGVVVVDGGVVVELGVVGEDPGTQGFATVADVPLGVVLLLLVLVPAVEPVVVLAVPVVVPLVLQGPATVPVALEPIPVEVVPV